MTLARSIVDHAIAARAVLLDAIEEGRLAVAAQLKRELEPELERAGSFVSLVGPPRRHPIEALRFVRGALRRVSTLTWTPPADFGLQNRDAIQAAVDTALAPGGSGMVCIPAGDYTLHPPVRVSGGPLLIVGDRSRFVARF